MCIPEDELRKRIKDTIGSNIALAVAAEACIISDWPYSKLVKEADVVAVVEVASVTNSADRLTGHRDPALYEGKIARGKVGWVIKGEQTPPHQS